MNRSVTHEEIETFWRDGVVCLRGILDPSVLAAMEPAVSALVDTPELADLSAMGDALAAGGQDVLREAGAVRTGRFISGVDHWRSHDEFRSFACDSALPAAVGALLRASSLRLWEDSVLAKEPGTVDRTAWHQDLAYFHADGDQVCTTWCPLDVVTSDSGAVQFVVGSHRWEDVHQPNLFVSTMVIPGTEGSAMPDIDALAAAGDIEVVSFDTVPGDVTVHHARTVHGAGPNTTDRWRRAISVRYCGDDVRYRMRPGAPRKAHHDGVEDGDVLTDPDTPLVWSR